MITTKHGSIFDSTAAVLVCPVNCVGVMGAGLAKEFKRRWPEACKWYFANCNRKQLRPGGQVWTFEEKIIVFSATKDHWRLPSHIDWVEKCLTKIARLSIGLDKSIAIPQLGCGCGGLDWADVWPLYEKHLGGLDCDVEVWIHP